MNPQPDWMEHAACIDADPALFFPSSGQPSAPAKAICRTCPVRFECLEYALVHETTSKGHGVWGGTTGQERDRIRRRRAQGLPGLTVVV